MTTESQACAELPKYACHKEVHALKIKDIDVSRLDHHGCTATITPADEGFVPFEVDWDYMTKHQPKVGGYYVVYADGYKSFSPAKAFEDGYTRIV